MAAPSNPSSHQSVARCRRNAQKRQENEETRHSKHLPHLVKLLPLTQRRLLIEMMKRQNKYNTEIASRNSSTRQAYKGRKSSQRNISDEDYERVPSNFLGLDKRLLLQSTADQDNPDLLDLAGVLKEQALTKYSVLVRESHGSMPNRVPELQNDEDVLKGAMINMIGVLQHHCQIEEFQSIPTGDIEDLFIPGRQLRLLRLGEDQEEVVGLGQGPLGFVLLAQCNIFKRLYAVKFFKCWSKDWVALASNVAREVLIGREVAKDHDNIVAGLHGLCCVKDPSGKCFSMAAVFNFIHAWPFTMKSLNLEELLRMENYRLHNGFGKLVEDDLYLKLVVELLQNLTTLKNAGVTHCDLKPSNILLRAGKNELEPIIIDFGLALYKSCKTTMLPVDFTQYVLLERPGWLAPECARGRMTFKSDLYSLGHILLQIAKITSLPSIKDFGKSLMSESPKDRSSAARVFQKKWRKQMKMSQKRAQLAKREKEKSDLWEEIRQNIDQDQDLFKKQTTSTIEAIMNKLEGKSKESLLSQVLSHGMAVCQDLHLQAASKAVATIKEESDTDESWDEEEEEKVWVEDLQKMAEPDSLGEPAEQDSVDSMIVPLNRRKLRRRLISSLDSDHSSVMRSSRSKNNSHLSREENNKSSKHSSKYSQPPGEVNTKVRKHSSRKVNGKSSRHISKYSQEPGEVNTKGSKHTSRKVNDKSSKHNSKYSQLSTEVNSKGSKHSSRTVNDKSSKHNSTYSQLSRRLSHGKVDPNGGDDEEEEEDILEEEDLLSDGEEDEDDDKEEEEEENSHLKGSSSSDTPSNGKVSKKRRVFGIKFHRPRWYKKFLGLR